MLRGEGPTVQELFELVNEGTKEFGMERKREEPFP